MDYLIDAGPSGPHSWSAHANALKCLRFAAWSAQDRARGGGPCPSPALIKGSLMHVGLAHHYELKRQAPLNEKLEEQSLFCPDNPHLPHEAIQVLADSQPDAHKGFWNRYVLEVQKTLDYYLLHWGSESWRPRAIERILETTIEDEERGKSYDYTQRADAIFTHPLKGKHFIWDHKTTFRIQESTTKRYTLSGQFLGYNMLGNRLFGERYGGVLLNMIGWCDKNKGPQFERIVVPYSPFAQERFLKTLLHARRMMDDHAHLEPGQRPGAHHETVCWGTYGPCKYFHRCQHGE